ncbi:MAG: hypothetical protein JWL62_1912 [Hyphomicrobiales bacterium]|nr:hypothetical protein [Hyphomicrobiales bacterium]
MLSVFNRLHMTLERVGRGLGWLGSAAIIGLSLVPGSLRPHVVSSGHAEHFVAYLATGLCFCFGARSNAERLATLCGLAVLSGLVEIAQLWIPGRTGELGGFVFSSAGALVGTIVSHVAARISTRPAKV